MPEPPSGPPSRFSLLFVVLRGGFAGFVAAAVLELLYIFVGTNVHVVAPGYVYRAAHLDGPDLKQVARQYGIRTVINLTGCCDPLPPYLEESRATSELNICQEDIGFSACRLPPVPELRELVEALDRCDYPILFHCHRGIDRTGMASAVALLLHTHTSLTEAREQLGLRYGHWPFGKTAQMDHFFDLYQEWLGGRPHSPENFRRWAVTDYCPGECRRRSSGSTRRTGRCAPSRIGPSASASAALTAPSSRGCCNPAPTPAFTWAGFSSTTIRTTRRPKDDPACSTPWSRRKAASI